MIVVGSSGLRTALQHLLRRGLRGASTVVLAVLTVGCAGLDAADLDSSADVELSTAALSRELSVQIRRTSYGIPHIEAADELGLGFGAGYVFAQDNLCLLAEELVTVSGERSLYFGADASFEPSSDGTVVSNVASDAYFMMINDAAHVDASWLSQPADIKDLIRGYARGVNRYLRDANGAIPEECRRQPWVRDLTELDVVRILRRFAVEGSGARMIEAIYAAKPPTVGAAPGPTPLRDEALARSPMWDRFQTPLGSNGIALGRDATASRAGELFASPHFPWKGVFRFYQLHLVIPGKVDVMGATPGGLPIVAIGHNADVAWTHTVNTSVHFTFHQLTLDPRDATRYMVDGVSRPLRANDVRVKVRLANGEIGTLSHRIWSSELGPLVAMPGSFNWTTRTAFAFNDANADNTRFLQTWWQIDRARSLPELRAAVEDTLGIPWVHTIAVDAAGTTYYGDVTPVPYLPDDPKCIPAGFGPLAATGQVVLDGSATRCSWQVMPGTPTPGIMPASMLPTLSRTDFVQNSNDSAWFTNPAAPLTGYPAIVSRDTQPLNPRTRFGLSYLTSELAAGHKFTPRGMLDFAFSNRAFYAQSVVPDLRQLCAGNSELAAPCGLISLWDGTANLDSAGWLVYRAWRKALDAATTANQITSWRVPFNPADPIATPSGLRIADPRIATLSRAALTTGMQSLAASGIDPARRWGDLQSTMRDQRAIPIHGGGGDRAGGRGEDSGNEIYNKINSRFSNGRFEPFFGTSIVMSISFEGGTPSALGVLSYSQSSNPASPHYADQTDLFSRKQWIEFPYSEEAIQADPELTVEQLTD